MPYVKPHIRKHLQVYLPADPGELAYVLMTTVLKYVGGNPTFSRYAEALGVLEAIKLELYRRQIAPYEDAKMLENGDV
jgi:hypothetical protein